MFRPLLVLSLIAGWLGTAQAQNLVDNPSFEDGLTGWSQATQFGNGTFEAVANGGNHSFSANCQVPGGFPNSGSFWSESCQGDPEIHALYQDFYVPAAGAVLEMIAGVDMCSAPGGCEGGTKSWTRAGADGAAGAGIWTAGKGAPAFVCDPLTGGAAPKGGNGDDCVRIDIVDPAGDVLDPTGPVLVPGVFSVNQDVSASPIGIFDLAGVAGQTVRLRLWVQASGGQVGLHADTVRVRPRAVIPTLQPLGLALLALVLGGAGLVARRRG